MLNDVRLAWKWIGVYRKASPQIKRLRVLTSMKLTTSTFWQIVTILLQILNLVLPMTSGKVKIYIATVIGCITIILHNIAGNTNPDGTPVGSATVTTTKVVAPDTVVVTKEPVLPNEKEEE